jgi:hypothetical protein
VNFFFVVAIVLLIFIGLFTLSGSNYLKTEKANPTDVQGNFTLILYGSGSSNDFANIAILDREGSPYTFEILAPDFSYTVQTGMDAAQALQTAERFVQGNIRFERSQLRRIQSPAGTGVGYELRPLYPVATFGKDDVLDVKYRVKDRKILVSIALDSAIEKQIAN